MKIRKPFWLKTAETYIGVKEVKGPRTAPIIMEWLIKLGAWWRDDETPWCAALPAIVFQRHGIVIPKYWMRAKAWLDWGRRITAPVLGCVVIFDRKGGGHIGFVVGETSIGDLLVLGANQNDEVKISKFYPERVIGYRIPPGFDYRLAMKVPIIDNQNDYSTSED